MTVIAYLILFSRLIPSGCFARSGKSQSTYCFGFTNEGSSFFFNPSKAAFRRRWRLRPPMRNGTRRVPFSSDDFGHLNLRVSDSRIGLLGACSTSFVRYFELCTRRVHNSAVEFLAERRSG